jgi:hypothetical protein
MSNVEQIAGQLGFPVVVLPDGAAVSMDCALRFLVGCLAENGFLQTKFVDEIVTKF